MSTETEEKDLSLGGISGGDKFYKSRRCVIFITKQSSTSAIQVIIFEATSEDLEEDMKKNQWEKEIWKRKTGHYCTQPFECYWIAMFTPQVAKNFKFPFNEIEGWRSSILFEGLYDPKNDQTGIFTMSTKTSKNIFLCVE